MSKAWLIGHITIKDAVKWAEYRSRVPATRTEAAEVDLLSYDI